MNNSNRPPDFLKKISGVRIIYAILTLILFVLFFAWFIHLAPRIIGGPATYVFVSGKSMQPLLVDGDIAVAKELPEYQVGDLVVFIVQRGEQEGYVIHRIHSGSANDGWKTKGDNNNYVDSWLVTNDAILGKYAFSISGFSTAVTWVKFNPLQFATIISLFVLFSYAPIKPKRLPERIKQILPIATKEPRRDGRSNTEYLILFSSSIATLISAGSVTSYYFQNLLFTKFGIALIIGLILTLTFTILFIYRLYDGFGVQEPSKSMYALSGRLYLVNDFPIEAETAVKVKNAIELRKIAEKYRLPILHKIDQSTGRHSFLLITAKKGSFIWKPPIHSVSRGASFFEDSKKPINS